MQILRIRSAHATCRRALAAAAIALSALALAAEPPVPHVAIDVRQSGDIFVVDANFFAPVPPAVAWEVLTDFDRMETFVPNLVDSRIVMRDGNRLSILQHGVARFGLLSLRFESMRTVTLTPTSSIRSTQLRGTMNRLDSLTTFAPEGDGTRLRYHVEAIPGVPLPDVVTKGFLRHEIAEQFDAILREMARRHRGRSRRRARPQAASLRLVC